ncbi:MAG: hypothetical protein Q9225_003944 [Loekoesia sp. 1 TL-2023]
MEASIEAKADVYHSAPIEVACESDEQLVIEKHGTQRDVHDMARMGKVQLLRRWHGSLIAIALVFFSLFLNTVLAQNLPSIEGVILVLHFLGFIAILVPLWVLAPKSSARDVFTTFNDGGDWRSTGLAVLIGILSPQLSLIGPDAAVHMSEEVRNASKTIPRIMLATMLLNGALGFIMLITLCFCIGNLQDVLQTATGYPFIQVRPGRDIPLNAILATTVFSILLISISFGSTIAFNQLTALGTVALLSSYMVSIGCMAMLRIKGRPLLRCHFSLGRYGLVVNILAFLFLMFSFVMICFPPARDPTLQSMNWSIVIFSGVLALSWCYYLATARHKYVGPVRLVKRVE